MRTRILLTITLIIMATGATAQTGLAVFAGATLPDGEPFKNIAKPGGHLGLELTLPIIPSLLYVGGQGSLSRNSFDFDDYPPEIDYSATFYTGEVLAIGRLYLPATGLFAKVGLGFNRYSVQSDDFDDYDSETHLCGAVGAGMSFTGLELNAMYHVVKWDEEADDPSTLDELEEVNVDFSYFTISAAFSF